MLRDARTGAPELTQPMLGSEQEGALLRTSLDAMGEAVIVTDHVLDPPGPRIVYVNPAFTRMTGYSADEVLGRSPRLLQGPGTDRAMLDRLRAALVAGRSFRNEALNYRKDGGEYVVEWLIAPVRSGSRITHWIAVQRDVTAERQAAAQMQLLAREVDHRANNTLAVVQSILKLTPADDAVTSFRQAVLGRVSALARVQTLLAEDGWAGVDLRALLEGEIAPFRNVTDRVWLAGPDVVLPPDTAQPLAMALHELATNAVKHGALSVHAGSLAVSWSVGAGTPDVLRLRWTEAGGPAVRGKPGRRGFGWRVLDGTVSGQLGGMVRLSWEAAGLVCEMAVPLRPALAPALGAHAGGHGGGDGC